MSIQKTVQPFRAHVEPLKNSKTDTLVPPWRQAIAFLQNIEMLFQGPGQRTNWPTKRAQQNTQNLQGGCRKIIPKQRVFLQVFFVFN